MKMIPILAVCMTAAAFAQEPQKKAEAVSKEEANAKVRASIEASGGLVFEAVPADAKYITIVDRRTKKDEGPTEFARRIKNIFRVPVRVADAQEGDTVIELVDDGETIVYPDRNKVITTGGSDMAETIRQLQSAFIYVVGVQGNRLSPMSMKMIVANCNKRGIPTLRHGTYRSACEHGWAPAPTNDVQKAIWEEAKKATVTNAPSATSPAK